MFKVSAAFPHSARWGWLLPVLALCATPAQSAESGAELETVIVTAQKRSESVQDIPLSISVLNTEQLEDRGFSGTSDLAKLVPGFSFVQTGVNAPVYSIRGVGFYETSLASSPAVSVYVDEVSLPYPAMTAGAALDVERVEVLKGPQGTLYGQNSTGGLVNYISRKPTDSLESGVRASIARFGLYELEGYLSGPLTETLNGRLAVQSALGDDWQRSISRNEENGEVERTAARLLLDWRPTDDLSLLLNVNGWIDRSDTTAPRLIAVTPNNAVRLLPIIRDATLVSGSDPRDAEWNPGQNLYRDDKLWQASLKAAWSFREGLTLTSITAFTNYDTEAYNERDGTPYENSEYPTVGSIESFAQELRLDGEIGGLVRWVAGANYFNDTTSDNQLIRYRTASNVQSVNGFPFTVGLTRANQEIESYAAFLSADWTLSERLTLTTGARYTEETRKLEACSYSTDPNQLAAFAITSRNNRIAAGLPPAPFVPVDDCFTLNEVYLPDLIRKKLAEDNVSWRLALGWTATDDVLVYASVSEGFKSGSFPTQGSSSEAQYRAARQENVLAYEAGVKTTLFARTLQLNGSVFYYDYENKQTRGRVIDAVFGPLQALVNIPKSSSQGAELDATWRVTQGLTLYGGVAYTKSEIDTYLGYTQLGQRLDFAGRPFSFTPEWQAVADVSYTWPLRGDLIASVGLGAAHKSRSSADSFSSPLFDIDAYTLLDARAKLAGSDESWSVELWVRNLTDEYYWTNVFKATDTTVQLPAYPMSYGATLRYRFR